MYIYAMISKSLVLNTFQFMLHCVSPLKLKNAICSIISTDWSCKCIKVTCNWYPRIEVTM